MPITDLSPDALINTATPLESQSAVQETLGTEQEHAAVYVPDNAVLGDAIPAVHSHAQRDMPDAASKAARKDAGSSTAGKSGVETLSQCTVSASAAQSMSNGILRAAIGLPFSQCTRWIEFSGTSTMQSVSIQPRHAILYCACSMASFC